MNRDVVEGNSTSLRSSARFPAPQESLALMDTPSLHVNDLGLTPSPGLQLRENSVQDEKHDCFDNEHEPADAAVATDGIEQRDKETGLEGFETQNNTIDLGQDLFDPLFDSTIPELGSLFSRKRTAEESQEFLPEKRQQLEYPETPSLTTDSELQSPASFFDTFDNLFGSGVDLPLVLPHNPIPDFEDDTVEPPLGTPRTSTPGVSESTKGRFFLNEQDILSTTTREIFQVGKQPEYTSPYPAIGGPLGYIPSSPGMHVKCVAVGKEKQDHEILSLQTKLSQITRERDQYKRSLLQYTKLDHNGKVPEQVLREENAMIRRVSSRHQARVEKYKKEAADWRGKLHAVSTLYNALLYEIQVEKRVPTVDSIPAGYKRPRMSASVLDQIIGHAAVPPPRPQNPVHLQSDKTLNGNIQPSAPATQQNSHRAVTIDLTEENEAPAAQPPSEEERRAALKSLQSKKYNWLEAGNGKDAAENTVSSIDDDELALMMEEELSRA
ncbi:hypothetical protein ASPVEDRAFT_302151 [Aspergillus versicolor CBS 583.65]|uniref:Uncharacterized protein n=1 Tax=Aspergillus versicolor CBS 583.65 TaxID=1036611 RepID=A0A1L9P830_ASPVE|nr:uncharacterized protein ASPVEDRAFT_302151 [Aspergillus versicolor CBS 583.65]OJI97636.1 hypothetical protein ASPVEDRAFT_302151 [Aspergillus versicolor CBS 583.65]